MSETYLNDIITKFYEAWNYLEKNNFMDRTSFEVQVVKINPITNEIDDEAIKNTKVQFWIEVTDLKTNTHLYKLDCGGDTYEEAIIQLAQLVKENGYSC